MPFPAAHVLMFGTRKPHSLTSRLGGALMLGTAMIAQCVAASSARGEPLQTSAVSEPVASRPIIVLDAGHGGKDPGSISKRRNGKTVTEREIVSSVVVKTAERLRAKGYDVFFTHELQRGKGLFPAPERRAWREARFGNQNHVLVSFHANSLPKAKKVSGAETFYRDPESRPLAEALQRNIAAVMGHSQRGVENRELAITTRDVDRDGNPDPPSPHTYNAAALVELGYLSNDNDLWQLQTRQDELAEASASAIDEFAGNPGQYAEFKRQQPDKTIALNRLDIKG